jgi:hypothetical protein
LKLNTLKLALAAAIVSAIFMSLVPVYAIYYGRGLRAVSILNSIYPGYNVSWRGAGMGLVYGFVTCFVYTAILGGIYNGLLTFKGIKIKAGPKAKPAGKKKRK